MQVRAFCVSGMAADARVDVLFVTHNSGVRWPRPQLQALSLGRQAPSGAEILLARKIPHCFVLCLDSSAVAVCNTSCQRLLESRALHGALWVSASAATNTCSVFDSALLCCTACVCACMCVRRSASRLLNVMLTLAQQDDLHCVCHDIVGALLHVAHVGREPPQCSLQPARSAAQLRTHCIQPAATATCAALSWPLHVLTRFLLNSCCVSSRPDQQ